MTERRGVPPPPKAESERVAKLIGQQRRQVNQSDESLQKQNIFIFFSHFAIYVDLVISSQLLVFNAEMSIHCQ